MNLTQRTIQSSLWNFSVNILQLILTFIRSVFLARWLAVDLFGIYAYAGSIVALSLVVPRFGMDGAFLNRVPETEDEDAAAAIHFTLQLLFTSVWAVILLVGGYIAFDSSMFTALLVLVAAGFVNQLCLTPRLILIRRVTHRRLASISLIDASLTTLVALGLAWFGGGIWALLSMDIVTALIAIVGIYLWSPVWKPRFAWKLAEVKYFLTFGRKTLLAIVLGNGLDRFDDIWAGFFLGDRSLAFYSKAYAFALMPGRIIGDQINSVIRGSYAELKEKRESLSKAFSLANEVMIRSGFFLAGVLFLIAPDLIRELLGEKWLPLVLPFQLMLVYTLFNPLKTSIGGLFVAVGRPETIVRARAVQLAIMLLGLFTLGFRYGVTGVALAVDLMLVLGLVLQLLLARDHVDYSWKEMFLNPSLSLLGGLLLCLAVSGWIQPASRWGVILYSSLAFTLGYISLYLLLEYRRLTQVYLPLVLNAIQGQDSGKL